MSAIKVARLPLDPGPSGWNRLLPEPPAAESLSQQITADYLIIGAGFAGLSTARRLVQLQPQATVAVLEAQRLGDGPAGRSSGFMIDLPHDLASSDYGGDATRDREQIKLNRAAIEFAADAAREYGMTREAFSACGKLNAAATDKGIKHNEDYAGHLASLDEPSQMVDAAEMQKITGSTWFRGGLFTPGAAIIQSALYIRKLAEGLSSRVSLYENSPCIALQKNGPDWTARTAEGAVTASKVILAVNGHVQSFGFFKRQLLHVFTYASMTRELTDAEIKTLGGDAVWSATPSDPMGTTVRRITGTGGARIVIRNRFNCEPSMQINDKRLASITRTHDQSFADRFPMLPDVDMQYRWGGRLCLSKNNVSAFGQLDDGLYSACCQNGLGVCRGTLGGMMAAELACGHQSDTLTLLQREAPPVKLPPNALLKLGANLVIGWQERQAGAEL
jgi:glycine/D-amino acid oxidase-like deaminating enzyme